MNSTPMMIAFIALAAERNGTAGSKALPLAIFAGMMMRQPIMGVALAMALSREDGSKPPPTLRIEGKPYPNPAGVAAGQVAVARAAPPAPARTP